MNKTYDNLMKPIQVGKVKIKNRLSVAPLGTFYLMAGPKGEYNYNAIEYYVERARGGFGLIVMGSIIVDMEADKPNLIDGPIPPSYAPGTWRESAIRLTDRIHAYGTKVFMQLGFGHGRMRPGQKAPSPIPRYHNPEELTEELTVEEIETKIRYMVETAKMAKSAGYDGVEVHAMHWGYLLDQFAMSISNLRTDEYGGDLEGRLTVARKIVEGIKRECGEDFPVSMRIGLKSYIKGFNQPSLSGEDEAGRTIEEAIEIAQLLEKYGYDMLNVNSGIYDSFYYCAPPAYMEKGYNLHLAKQVKEAVSIPVFTAGRMDDPNMCEEAVADGYTDGVSIGRASLAEPHYAQKLQMGCPESIRPCISCENCMMTNFSKGGPTCAVNPSGMKEGFYTTGPATIKKRIAVIGGGVAGMEAARNAAIRGHQVDLYEQSDKLGGYLYEAGAHFFKESIRDLSTWYIRELEEKRVTVHLNSRVTASMIKGLKMDTVILAVGSDPLMPKAIPGIDHKMTVSAIDVFNGKELGERVTIIGAGLVGAEMAYDLGREGKKVTLVDALPDILSNDPSGIPFQTKDMLSELLDANNVTRLMEHRLAHISDEGAVLVDKNGEEKVVNSDHVVLAIGFKSRESMLNELFGQGIELYEIAPANGIGSIATQINTAYELTKNI